MASCAGTGAQGEGGRRGRGGGGPTQEGDEHAGVVRASRSMTMARRCQAAAERAHHLAHGVPGLCTTVPCRSGCAGAPGAASPPAWGCRKAGAWIRVRAGRHKPCTSAASSQWPKCPEAVEWRLSPARRHRGGSLRPPAAHSQAPHRRRRPSRRRHSESTVMRAEVRRQQARCRRPRARASRLSLRRPGPGSPRLIRRCRAYQRPTQHAAQRPCRQHQPAGTMRAATSSTR